jgi:hypothetical protein
MGLLDEAIREHLELKRRAGADASEVARQEREALGPVVRGDPLTADLPPGAPAYEAPPGQFGPQAYDDGGEGYEDDYDAEYPETDEHRLPPPAPAGPVHYPPAGPVHYPPAGGAADEHHAEPAADDVLEQTPEFLQETPEHDRLWFEQAPPQEFDFDK